MNTIFQATIAGETVNVLAVPPNGAYGTSVKHRLNTHVARSMSGRESRRPLCEAVRFGYSGTWSLDVGQTRALRTSLGSMAASRWAVPLWPDLHLVSDHASSLYIAAYYLECVNGAIVTESQVSGLGDAIPIVPLFLGRVEERPKIQPITTVSGKAKLEFGEDAPWAWRVQIRNLTTVVAGTWPSVLVPNGPTQDLSQDNLSFETIGQGREAVVSGQEEPGRWGQSGDFLLNGRDRIRTLLTFWALRCRGRWQSFTMPSWFHPHWEDSAATPLNLTARFSDDELVLDYSYSHNAASCDLQFWQCPWEPTISAALPAIARLFVFTYDVPSPVTWTFTSWERPIVVDGQTYAPASIDHSSQSRDMSGAEECTIRASAELAPLRLARLGQLLPGRLCVDVFEVNPEDVSDVRQILSGIVGDVEDDDRALKANVAQPRSRKVPRAVVQKRNNIPLYSEESGIDKAAYAYTCTVAAVWPEGKLILTWADAQPSPTEKIFGEGMVESGSGLTYWIEDLVFDYRVSATERHVTPKVHMPHIQPGDTVRLYPGCSMSWSDQRATFNKSADHYLNFLGFPNIQIRNPSSVSSTDSDYMAGKGK